MNRRTSQAQDELVSTRGDKKRLVPIEAQLNRHAKLAGLVDERNATERENKVLKRQLRKVDDEVAALERKAQDDDDDFDDQIEFIFFNYLPSNPYNYSHSIGPVDYDIVETETSIGMYDIGDFLGDGHYASVHVGTHRRTKELCALKKLSKKRMVSLNDLKQLEKELKVLRSVDHDNIMKLHGTIHAPEHIYLILELGHQDLFEYMRNHADSLTLGAIREVAIGILQGVAYLHEHGVAHLDIKEENILISREVSVENLDRSHMKLCDFGLCVVQSGAAAKPSIIPLDRLCGTPGFFAPEIITDVKSADGRSADMWSVGATLLEVVEELSPEWMDAYEQFKKGSCVFEEGIAHCVDELYSRRDSFADADLHDLICQLLVMKPTSRLTAAEALDHAWIQMTYVQESDKEVHDGFLTSWNEDRSNYRRRSV